MEQMPSLRKTNRKAALLFVLGLFGAASGCANVPGPREEKDPLESFNRAMFTFNETVDGVIMKPLAIGYNALPDPVNKGVTNFFGNIGDVVILLNDILQLKLTHAASDAGRIAFNSTVGLLGFIDVATPMGFKKRDEDFGQTLGYWGVGSGPYLVLPIIGPSSIRDTVGRVADYHIDPITYVRPTSTRGALMFVEAVDTRADLLSASKVFEEAALDQYLFVRDAYLQRRRSQVYDGDPPREKFEEYENN